MAAPLGHDGSEDPSEPFVGSLLGVTSGASVALAGTVSGMALMLVGRGLFTRAYEPSEYGLFSLAFTVASILTAIAALGLWNGISRQIAYFGAGGSEDGTTAGSIITWGLLTTAAAGVVVAAALFALSEWLAVTFGHPEYDIAFRVAAFALPFLALIRVATAIFCGFRRTHELVAFQELLQKGSFPLLLAVVVWLGWGFTAAMYVFPATLAVTAVAYVAYIFYDDPGQFRRNIPVALGRPRDGYDLLVFSFPLMFASLLIQVMAWTDTLMLGYFTNAETVGIYDGVHPLVRYGILGAATATGLSLVLRNTIRTAVLYRISRTHSLKPQLLVPVLSAIAVAVAAYRLLGGFITSLWHLGPVFACVFVVYVGTMSAAGYVSDDDRALVASIVRGVRRTGYGLGRRRESE